VVTQGEPLLELETEKSVVEIESTDSGRLVDILLQVDQEVRVGDRMPGWKMMRREWPWVTARGGSRPRADARRSDGARRSGNPWRTTAPAAETVSAPAPMNQRGGVAYQEFSCRTASCV